MRMLSYLTSASLALFATSASAQTVTYDYDRATNFSSYKTYTLTSGADVPDELNHRRVVRAIDAALGAKGLARVEPGATPDVLVVYHVSFEESMEMTDSERGWSGWRSSRAQRILIGTLIVDLCDARTGAIVWRSAVSGDIRPIETPDARDKKVAKAAEKMFRNYPAKSR